MNSSNEYMRMSHIEDFMQRLVVKSGCATADETFSDKLPSVIKDYERMVFIDTNSQNANGPYISGSVSIYLYVRPTSVHLQAEKRELDSMESKMRTAIEESRDEHYMIEVNWSDSGYDDSATLLYNILNVSIIVK